MMLPPKFAAMPKAASRTLKAHNLLGEAPGMVHNPIRKFPDWEKYDWHVVVRGAESWLASMLNEIKKVDSAVLDWVPACAADQLYKLCYETITDGVACTEIAIGDLDAWLLSRWYVPHHLNTRVTL